MVMSSGEAPEWPPYTTYDREIQRSLGAYMLNSLHCQAQETEARERSHQAAVIAAMQGLAVQSTELPPAA